MGLFTRRKDSPVTTEHSKPAYDPRGKQQVAAERSSTRKLPVLVTTMAESIPEIDIPEAPDPTAKPAHYLRSIYAVRQRSRIVLDKAKANQLNHFDVDMSKFEDTAAYVTSIIKVCEHLSSRTLLTSYSETSHQTTVQYHLMDVGNTLKLVVDHV